MTLSNASMPSTLLPSAAAAAHSTAAINFPTRISTAVLATVLPQSEQDLFSGSDLT
jgi:hypothetical protein